MRIWIVLRIVVPVVAAALMVTAGCSQGDAGRGKAGPSAMLEDLEYVGYPEGGAPILKLEEPRFGEIRSGRVVSTMLEDVRHVSKPGAEGDARAVRARPVPMPEEPRP